MHAMSCYHISTSNTGYACLSTNHHVVVSSIRLVLRCSLCRLHLFPAIIPPYSCFLLASYPVYNSFLTEDAPDSTLAAALLAAVAADLEAVYEAEEAYGRTKLISFWTPAWI